MVRALATTVLLALSLTARGASAAPSCGGPDSPCKVESGSYHIAVPDGPGPFPVVVFLHGYGGRGAAVMRGGAARVALSRGYAFIAPNALARENGRTSWNFHPAFREGRRDELAFLRGVLADAAARFGVDPARALLAGFSIGGSMVSYIACEAPGAFLAYAPVAGSFWRPEPERCAGPVRLLHTHGWRDRTVPLEGRVLGDRAGTRFAQGDVFRAMAIWRAANGCDNYRADAFETDERFWRRRWTACRPGTALELVLHPGAHGVPPGWAELALDWFEALADRVAR